MAEKFEEVEMSNEFKKFVGAYGEEAIVDAFIKNQKVQPNTDGDCPVHYIKDKDGQCVPDFPLGS